MKHLLKEIGGLGMTLAVLQLWSCTEPFVPEVKKPPSLLVVEGHLSDDESANLVHLSRSQPLGTGQLVPEVAACVTVIDEYCRRPDYK